MSPMFETLLIDRDDRGVVTVTLNRPDKRNAMDAVMLRELLQVAQDLAADASARVVVLTGAGTTFCAGGDMRWMQEQMAGDREMRRSGARALADMLGAWDRMSKPVIARIHGACMGGGVGLGCHCSHRIVGDTSQIAMPEVGIGLVPDVGGSMILAHAPGQLGDYLGLTAARMDAGNAIYAGFADTYAPEDAWDDLKQILCDAGSVDRLPSETTHASFAEQVSDLSRFFQGDTPADVARALSQDDGPLAQNALKKITSHSPLAMAAGLQMIRRLRSTTDITRALEMEYRFTYRAMEHGDFIEGIRAAIIDKDRSPKGKHTLAAVPMADVAAMLRPLGPQTLNLEDPL